MRGVRDGRSKGSVREGFNASMRWIARGCCSLTLAAAEMPASTPRTESRTRRLAYPLHFVLTAVTEGHADVTEACVVVTRDLRNVISQTSAHVADRHDPETSGPRHMTISVHLPYGALSEAEFAIWRPV